LIINHLEKKREKILAVLRNSDRWNAQEGLIVEQVMTPSPECISTSQSVLDVVKLFHARGHRHLLVVGEQDQLIGVISDRDVLRCFGPDKYPDPSRLASISAAEIMSTDVITISSKTPLHKAITITVEHGISSLPIVDDGTLVGILTDTDLRLLLERLLPMLRESPVVASSSPLH